MSRLWKSVTALAVSVAAAGGIVWATTAVSQDQATPKPAAKAATPAKPKPAPAPGQVAQAPAAAGAAAPAVSELVGEWKLDCTTTPVRRCQISQKRITNDNNIAIWVEIARTAGAADGDMIAVMMPLGLRLAPQIALLVDDKPVATLGLVTCYREGCLSSAKLDANAIAALRAGKILRLGVQNLQGQPVPVGAPATGFGEAYGKLATFTRT